FQAHPAGFLRALLAVAGEVVVVPDHLGAYEPALEVGVDHPRTLRGSRTDGDGPGPDFLRPGGKEGLQAQQRVGGPDEPVEPRLLQPEIGKKDALVLVAKL